jgi:hypothetical protein
MIKYTARPLQPEKADTSIVCPLSCEHYTSFLRFRIYRFLKTFMG